MKLKDWIFESTKDCEAVVEFGAGFFSRLKAVSDDVKYKIGIEISEVYIEQAVDFGGLKIQGDMREFESYIADDLRDCAMFIDSLEHLTRKDAFNLVLRVQKHFNRIILMVPEGDHPQLSDVTGNGQHEFQKHRSTWHVKDIEKMGFQKIRVDADFHKGVIGKADGCIFATWRKNDQAN